MERELAAPQRSRWWQEATTPYQRPDWRRSTGQIVTAVLPYVVLWYLMYRSLAVSYWLTLALTIPTAGFLMRTFIIFHDCGHGSFFKSRRANDIIGTITGILTFTPYYQWRHEHAVHHATSGDLDRRGVGDVWMLTVREYQAAPPLRKFFYRGFRHPVFMLGFGGVAMFGIAHRIPTRTGGRRERVSAYTTDLALLVIWVAAALTIGLRAYLLVQVPLLVLTGAMGIWMFYVQHQYPGVRWVRHDRWDFATAALENASFYKLPRLLNYFTGSIGFHHIHHLNPSIPNYLLEECHRAHPAFQKVAPLTMRQSLAALRMRLWHEERRVLVGFGEMHSG